MKCEIGLVIELNRKLWATVRNLEAYCRFGARMALLERL